VPSYMGITGNERADKVAKDALDQNVETTIKVVKSDYCKWVKDKNRQRWQNEWRNSTSSMVTINHMSTDTRARKAYHDDDDNDIKVKNGLHQHNTWTQNT
jgi:hypothetical protein